MYKDPRIAIIGGGPAGISLSQSLFEQGLKNTTVFEKEGRIGGKSLTLENGANVIELGTCYITPSHKITNKWMQLLGHPIYRVSGQKTDNDSFQNYVMAAGGRPAIEQVARYLLARRKLMSAMGSGAPSSDTLKEASTPIGAWLRERKLFRIERALHRGITAIGYGFLDHTTTYQAMRWMDWGVMIAGVLGRTYMPQKGWSAFWRDLALYKDIRTGEELLEIERTNHNVRIKTTTYEGTFDYVVCAIPFDTFYNICEPNADEIFINEGTRWDGYTTTLISARDWFTDTRLMSYSKGLLPGAKTGQLTSARYDGYDKEMGGHLYVTGQLGYQNTAGELKEILLGDLTRLKVQKPHIISQHCWQYHVHYKAEALREGLLNRLNTVQGTQRTFYTGATFSFESIANITAFNHDLAKIMKAQITASA